MPAPALPLADWVRQAVALLRFEVLATLLAAAVATSVLLLLLDLLTRLERLVWGFRLHRRRWSQPTGERAAGPPRGLGAEARLWLQPNTVGALLLGGLVGLRLLPRAPLVGLVFVAVGLLTAWYYRGRRLAATGDTYATEIGAFLALFVPLFEARRDAGVLQALRQALPAAGPRLRPHFDRILAAVAMQSLLEVACAAEIRAARNPHLTSLLMPLAHAQEAQPEATSRLLRRLALRLERRRLLTQENQVETVVLRKTFRFVQLVAAVLLPFVLLNPTWSEYYFASVGQQALLVGLVLFGLAGMLFVERELPAADEGRL